MISRFLILLLFCICAGCGCSKKGKNLGQIKVKEEQKAYNAYDENQQVRFKHSNGAIGQFTVSKKYENALPPNIGDCADYNTYEEIVTTLSSRDFDFEIEQRMTAMSQNYRQLIRFHVNRNKRSWFSIYENVKPTLESLTVNGKMYKNVYEMRNINQDNSKVYFTHIYYNQDFGIIKMSLSNGDTYTLL